LAWQRLKVKQNILKKKIIKIFENHNLISSHALICADALINAFAQIKACELTKL
jgi:hypothetical protein